MNELIKIESTPRLAPDEPPARYVSRDYPELPTGGDDLNEQSDLPDHRQRAAIELLLAGKSFTAAAQAIGVTRRTLYAWRQDEDFRGELDRRRRELYDGAADRLRALLHPSLDVMEQHLADPYDRARFRAAAAVLRMANLGKSMRE